MCINLREERSKLLFFFVTYLPELTANPNKKKYAPLTPDIKNVLPCQVNV